MEILRLEISCNGTRIVSYGQAELSFSIASKEEITNVTVTIDTELGIVQEEVKTLEVYPEKVKTSEGEEKTKSERITGGSAETALDINNSLHVVPLDSSSKDSAGSEANKFTVERESKYSVHTAKPFEQFCEFVQKVSRSQITRIKAEGIYSHAKNILAVPELDSITSTEIKYLISQIELNDENLMRYFNKKMSEGKHYYSALNATAAKILRIVFWVLKNLYPY